MQNPKAGLNNPRKVHEFLKQNPNTWFCDDCIDTATGVNRHEVNTIAWSFALFPKEFMRASARCAQNCSDREKISTQAILKSS
jgi:hypothetical protein